MSKAMERSAARERVIAAVLSLINARYQHEIEPGSYGAMASAEMHDDMLNEALDDYMEVIHGPYLN